MIAGIGLNEQPYTDQKEVVTMNTSWQTFTLDLTASVWRLKQPCLF